MSSTICWSGCGPLARDGNPFAHRRGPRKANFVAPELVAEIEFREMTAEGMIRHGSFKGLREDKPASEVELERPEGDVAEWYARMAEVLLPHLRGRPLTLKRYPDGAAPDRFLVEDLATLTRVANLGNVELYTSLSLASEMERPTAVVFDLDPGAPAGVLDCAQVALWIRGMLEQLGLSSYAKTSGSKGIQLYAPLNTDVTYERTKPFARAVAETLEAKFGDRVISRMTKAERAGKVLVDWSQNDRHKTTVCVYSLRAMRRPTVSTPLEVGMSSRRPATRVIPTASPSTAPTSCAASRTTATSSRHC